MQKYKIQSATLKSQCPSTPDNSKIQCGVHLELYLHVQRGAGLHIKLIVYQGACLKMN